MFNTEVIATAPLLALDTPQNLQLSAGEVAWFRIELQAGQAYEVLTTDLAEGLDTTITLFWPTGEEAAYNDDADGSASRIIFVPDVSTTLYVRVEVFGSGVTADSCVLLLRKLALPPPMLLSPIIR